MELVIGPKAWSTWSMRPWLVLQKAGVAFTETLIELRQENNVSADRILAHSPSGLVPFLKDGDVAIGDSLAICEYLAERFPAAGLWPENSVARAYARAAAAEMHAGFGALRAACPMDLAAAPSATELSDGVSKDVRRIVALWRTLLERFHGPWLGGVEWGIVDAFFTPVATRFQTYDVRLADHGDDGTAAAYALRLLARPEYLAWKSGI